MYALGLGLAEKTPNNDLNTTEIYLTLMIKSKGKMVQGLVLWFQTPRLLTSCFSVMHWAYLLRAMSYFKTVLQFQPSLLSPSPQEGGRESGRSCLLPLTTLPGSCISYSPLHLIIQNLSHIGTPTLSGG